MGKLSTGETLELLKKYTNMFINEPGLNKYDINSLDYLVIYNALVKSKFLPKLEENEILPEIKSFVYLFYEDVLHRKLGNFNLQKYTNPSSNVKLSHALWNWNNSKIIYKFDRDIEQDLIDNSDFSFNSQMPIELFQYLPHNNFFVSMNNSFYEQLKEVIVNQTNPYFSDIPLAKQSSEEPYLLGFFLNKDKLYKTDDYGRIKYYDFQYTVTILYHSEIRGCFCPRFVKIDLNIPKDRSNSLTILDCISKANANRDNKECELFITKILPYIFYLCSENAVIQERKISKKYLKKLYKDKLEAKPTINIVSKPIEERVLSRVFPSKSVMIEELNFSNKKGTAKCPHERRSHWHKYWVGKKNSEERRLVLKWLSSMRIRTDLKEIPNTKIKVKSNS